MEYLAVDHTRLVPSGAVSGSMATAYRSELIRTHAVRLVDGEPAPEAMCGFACRPDPASEPRDWETVNLRARCRLCAEALGEGTAAAGR